MRRPRRLPGVTFPVMAAAATLMLVGCLQIGTPTQPERPTTDPASDSGETVDVVSLAVGDCIDEPGASDTVTETTVVDCSAEHNFEVFGETTMPDGDFPGDRAISAQAEADCAASFQTFVGLASGQSVYELNFFVPTEGGWGRGDRQILCLINDPSGSNTGTLAGANR